MASPVRDETATAAVSEERLPDAVGVSDVQSSSKPTPLVKAVTKDDDSYALFVGQLPSDFNEEKLRWAPLFLFQRRILG